MRLLTVAEAAEALSLSASTVRALCAARRLRHERHGMGRGTIRVPEDALDEYRKSVTVGAGVPEQARPAPRSAKLRFLQLD